MITRDSAQARNAEQELAILRPLSRQFPNLDTALAAIARLEGELTLPKGTIHVISDVHGEHAKLRHVINNASGTLRPLVERMFKDRPRIGIRMVDPERQLEPPARGLPNGDRVVGRLRASSRSVDS